jgi:ribosomal protein S18 acetylase RimI-like enzyme
MKIEEVSKITDEVVEAMQRLIPQLSGAEPPSRGHLAAIVENPDVVLFVARDPDQTGRIVGTLTLALYRIPTGLRAWIEDVVVDEPCRRRGIGEALVWAAIARASQRGAKTVDLTSRMSRQQAHRLYRRLGFAQRDTQVYRYMCPPPAGQ